MPNVSLANAISPLVVAIDVGSSSVRALVYDARGNQVSGTEAKSNHTLRADKAGASEADPDLLFDLLCASIDRTLAQTDARAGHLAAIGMSCFWHGLMGIDRDGDPTTPIYMWADKRAGRAVPDLATMYEPAEAVRLTGCRMHSSYWPAKLRWLRDGSPDAFNRTAHWISFPDYVSLRLTGSLQTSVSVASGTGLMSTATADWYEPMVRLAKIEPAQLSPIFDRDQPLPPLLPEFQKKWPALATVPWFPALGDGAAANVGAGCVGPDRIALTVGTSGAMRTIVPVADERDRVPPGQLWVYRLDRHREVIGGALSNGGNVTAWLSERIADRSMDELTREAESLAPDEHGLTVLPFLAGERSPSWDDNATGVFAGLTLATGPAELFRAVLEATAYRFAAIYDDLRDVVAANHEIHANGAAVLGSPLWLQIMSDVLGHRVEALDAEAEASARGAAICALEAIGALSSLRPAESEVVRVYEPDPSVADSYADGRRRQQRLESAMRALETAIPST